MSLRLLLTFPLWTELTSSPHLYTHHKHKHKHTGAIRVYARCRPMAKYEIERGCKNVVEIKDENSLKVSVHCCVVYVFFFELIVLCCEEHYAAWEAQFTVLYLDLFHGRWANDLGWSSSYNSRTILFTSLSRADCFNSYQPILHMHISLHIHLPTHAAGDDARREGFRIRRRVRSQLDPGPGVYFENIYVLLNERVCVVEWACMCCWMSM